MSNPEWFIIDDLQKFVESTRVLIFDNFGNTETDTKDLLLDISKLDNKDKQELDEVLSQDECLVIAKDFVYKQKHKKTSAIRYLITNEKYMSMIESFNSRMVSNILNDLVNKNILETAYDETVDDFIFWIKDENPTEKPETD